MLFPDEFRVSYRASTHVFGVVAAFLACLEGLEGLEGLWGCLDGGVGTTPLTGGSVSGMASGCWKPWRSSLAPLPSPKPKNDTAVFSEFYSGGRAAAERGGHCC